MDCRFYWSSHGCDRHRFHLGRHVCGPGGFVYDEGELREDTDPCSEFRTTGRRDGDNNQGGMVRYFLSDGTWSEWGPSQGFWHKPLYKPTLRERLTMWRRTYWCLPRNHAMADWSPVVFAYYHPDNSLEQRAWRCARHDTKGEA